MKKKFAYLVIFTLIPSIVSCSINETPPMIDNPHLTKVKVNYEFPKTNVCKTLVSDIYLKHKEIKDEKAINDILKAMNEVLDNSVFYINDEYYSGWCSPYFHIEWESGEKLAIIFSSFNNYFENKCYAFQYCAELNGTKLLDNIYGFYSSKSLNSLLYKTMKSALRTAKDQEYILD